MSVLAVSVLAVPVLVVPVLVVPVLVVPINSSPNSAPPVAERSTSAPILPIRTLRPGWCPRPGSASVDSTS